MAEARLQAELRESNFEIERLRERMSLGAPTIYKDLSLITLIPKWSSPFSTVTLEVFYDSIEVSARIGRWQDSYNMEIAIFKLTDLPEVFYKWCQELHKDDPTWQELKNVFPKRYKVVHTYPYHL
jgi:hypothetical protein